MRKLSWLVASAASVAVLATWMPHAAGVEQSSGADTDARPASEFGFEIKDLAADRGITLEDAATRLQWQRALPGLLDRLPADLGDDYAGLWVDPADGDRLKLALVTEASSSSRETAQARLEEAGVSDATDITTGAHSLRQLQAVVDGLKTDVGLANQGSTTFIGLSVNPVLSRVEMRVPSEARRTPSQRSLIERERTRGKVAMVTENLSWANQGCNGSGKLSCDPPLRGGTLWQTATSGCTVGFYAKSRLDQAPYFLTSGHCAPKGTAAYGYNANGTKRNFGIVWNAYNDSRGDEAIVQMGAAGWSPRPWVAVLDRADTDENLEYSIRADGSAALGQRVCYTGSFSRNSDCGDVTDPALLVTGSQTLVRANYCGPISGDSGSPIFALATAFGMHKGAFSACDQGYQPVRTAENSMNVDVVFGP